jgi:phosphatidylglycerophosphatase A
MLAARFGSAEPAMNSIRAPEELYILQGVAILGVAGLGVWVAGRAADYFQQHDPKVVVIDEVSGQLIAWVGVALVDWQALVAGFVLFRLFDIWKPLLIRRTESLPGGWGIMADDWLAGTYAALLLHVGRSGGWV